MLSGEFMNVNEQLEMEKEIEKVKESGNTPTLLLHSCYKYFSCDLSAPSDPQRE